MAKMPDRSDHLVTSDNLLIWLSPTWNKAEMNPHAVAWMRLQARLITDMLTLQSHRAKFYGESPTCQLCFMEDETVTHVLARCPALSHNRFTLLQPILHRIQIIGDTPPTTDEDIIQVLLGYSSDPQLYNLGSNACYAILCQRQSLYPQR